MTDKFSKEKRSWIMSRIRGKGTRIEREVFKALRKRGIYFQKNYQRALGTPDLALPRKKKAVFIDGDFWHGYRYRVLKKKLPDKFWREKIERNIKRDRRYGIRLKKDGWKVLRIWEHELNKGFEGAIDRIAVFLKSD